jgi:hypothetical protein
MQRISSLLTFSGQHQIAPSLSPNKANVLKKSHSDSSLVTIVSKQSLNINVSFDQLKNNGKSIANSIQDMQFVYEFVHSDNVIGLFPMICLLVYTMDENDYLNRIQNMIKASLFFNLLMKVH